MPKRKLTLEEELERLCPACRELAASRYLARFGPPLEQCEECERLHTLCAVETGAGAPRDSSQPRAQPERELIGLCVDCESRHTCSLSDSPAGVWYCSEYR